MPTMTLEQENASLRQALAEKEDELFQLKSIIDALPGHVYWKDKEGVCLGCNTNNWKDFGLKSLSDYIGKTDYEMSPKETADRVRAIDLEVMASGQSRTVEEPATLINQGLRVYLSQKKPFKDKNGEIVGVLGISFDVTEQKRLEETLKEQNTFLEHLLNSFPLHIYWKDKDGKYLGANEQQAKSLGYAKGSELIGKTDFDLYETREEALVFWENDLKVMKSLKSLIAEEEAMFEGKQSVVLSYKSPLFDSSGTLIGMIGTSFDITDRKRLEEELQEKNKFLKNLINNFPLHVYWKDKGGRYLGANDLQAASAGFINAADLVGKRDVDISTREEADLIRQNDLTVMETEKTLMVEESSVFQGIPSTFLSCKSPLRDANGAVMGIIGTSLDITERKRLEAEKAQFYNSALQVAHDIRSPVAAIEMLSKMLTDLPERQRVLLRNATGRINDIANQLLIKYRNEAASAGRRMELLSALLLNLVSEKRLQLAKTQIQLEAPISKKAYFAFVHIDPTEFKRMLSNLINNAAEAMGAQGKITLQLDLSDLGAVLLKIIDQGPGIPAELLSRLGQQGVSFNKEGGSGLGLFHAKETMAALDGHFDIQSKLGEGTTISLTLPQAEPPHWFAQELVLRPGQTLYILDDDAAIHGAWDQRIQDIATPEDKIKIVHFTDPEEAIEKIKADQVRDLFDFNAALLTDYELIGHTKTGLDVIQALRLEQSLLVTSYFEKKEIQEGLQKTRGKLLPKNLASELPITIDHGLSVNDCEIVVLEDNRHLIQSIEFFAQMQKRKVKIYRTSASLFEDLPKIPKTMPFYLDNDIGEPQTGLEIGKILYDQGYKTLYFSTGAVDNNFVKPHWFIDVVDKADILK